MDFNEFVEEVKKVYKTRYEIYKNNPDLDIQFSIDEEEYIKQYYEQNKKYIQNKKFSKFFAKEVFEVFEGE